MTNVISAGFLKAQSDNLPKITVEMVTEFFANSENFNAAESSGVKVDRSKREEYGDKAIGYVEVKREGYLCTVKARVCPEHRVRNKPYIVVCNVDEEVEDIKEISCKDCAALTGGCKHAIAFLMWLHRRSEEPEPTATVCYWKKAQLSQVGTNLKYMLITEINCSKNKPNLPLNDNFFKRVVDEIQSKQNNFQISRHCISLNPSFLDVSLHQILFKFEKTGGGNVEDFLNFSQQFVSTCVCEKIAEETKDQTESKLWKELRYGRITASRIYEIAHCKTERGVLVEQIIGASKIKDTTAMKRGRELEKEVLAELKYWMQNIKIENSGLFLNPNYPIVGASPDALGPDFVVEIKCPKTKKAEKKYINSSNQITNRYLGQIQLQMFLTGKKRGFFCVAHHDFEVSKTFTTVCVELNETFIMDLLEKSMIFWKVNIFPILYNAVK